MRKSNCHWHGTFNAEKVYCTSFCIAIHSGRRHGDIMQERTTQSGLPRLFWGWKDTNFTGMWKFLINLVQFSTPYHLFNLVILYSITRAHSHISLFLSLLLLSHFEWWCCRHIKIYSNFSNMNSPQRTYAHRSLIDIEVAWFAIRWYENLLSWMSHHRLVPKKKNIYFY